MDSVSDLLQARFGLRHCILISSDARTCSDGNLFAARESLLACSSMLTAPGVCIPVSIPRVSVGKAKPLYHSTSEQKPEPWVNEDKFSAAAAGE